MPRARESRPSGRVSQMLVVICCRNIQLVRRQRPAMLIPKDCSLDCQSFSFYGIFRIVECSHRRERLSMLEIKCQHNISKKKKRKIDESLWWQEECWINPLVTHPSAHSLYSLASSSLIPSVASRICQICTQSSRDGECFRYVDEIYW